MNLGANLGVVVEDIGCIGVESSEMRVALNTLLTVKDLGQWFPVKIGKDWPKFIVLMILVCFDGYWTRLL